MSLSKILYWRGILGIAVGAVSVAWPEITVGAFVILFAAYAFLAGASDVVHAFSGERIGPKLGYLLPAVLSVATGVLAIAWPGITAFVITIWVATWALMVGAVEFFLAFRRGEMAGERAMWLFVRPDTGAVALASVFGLFAISYGISTLMLAGRIRAAR
jgi:uncharacterized membrane protein HdeD (DUF308 family)